MASAAVRAESISGQISRPGGGREQVVAAHHLVDAGQCVVDHHGKVVGGHTVAATQHEVVDDPLEAGSPQEAVHAFRGVPQVEGRVLVDR